MIYYTIHYILKVYIVTGGNDNSVIDSTETLLKDGGTRWRYAADLPSARTGIRGLSLQNGRFLVTGISANENATLVH